MGGIRFPVCAAVSAGKGYGKSLDYYTNRGKTTWNSTECHWVVWGLKCVLLKCRLNVLFIW